MGFLRSVALLLAAQLARAQSPAPYPNSTTTNATNPVTNSGSMTNQTSPPKYPSPWGEGLGDWGDAYAKARAFVSQLTLIEKVNLTTGVGWEGEQCVGNNGAIPRLAFKALCLEDSPLGVRLSDFNSAFSSGQTIAATWDRGLFYQRGFDMGTEHRLKGVDIQLGPVVGPIGRAPEGGRNWEGTPDELRRHGELEAKWLQASVPTQSCLASLSLRLSRVCRRQGSWHVLNTTSPTSKSTSGKEASTPRNGLVVFWADTRIGTNPVTGQPLADAISSNIDDVTMHELYLWPFADAIRAGTGSIMCSYNQVNNSYGCQNSYLLNYLLKGELGFQGFVMSDWGAQHSGVSSALAGLDQSMPGDAAFDSGTSFWGANLTIAVLNGTVPQWRLDDMAIRIMAAYYYVDRENNQVPDAPNFSAWTTDTFGYRNYIAKMGYQQINYHVNVQQEHGIDIRNQGSRATVLLKNTKKALPLTGMEALTGVFGEDAGDNAWGPNGCGDRGCDNGTLAMGWGSGTANFPYLVTPLTAIQNEILRSKRSPDVEGIVDNYAYTQIQTLATRVNEARGAAIVFVNSDSGEGYITVDGNEGDRNNLTLWHDGEKLIQNISALCNNTIVVIHSVGPVLVDSFYNNPNITAILWAGLPGQESGNSIADVLYGRVNPGAKLPFTMGASRASYGTDLLYIPNQGNAAPQQNFDEGVFIDYRAFDKLGETPIYEFGYGLSYTSFSFSNLQVSTHTSRHYSPTTGNTPAAPTYGTVSNNTASYLFPSNIDRVPLYIYPYLNSTSLANSSGDPQYAIPYTFPAGSSDGSPQPRVAAGGAPGGNPELWDILFTVTAQVTNTGSTAGDEVAQLYLNLGGPNDPKVVLRDFQRLSIQPGTSATFVAHVTRRDVSNWDTAAQNWVITKYTKTAYVGNSSRSLPLSMVLPMASFFS
ncbi:hypothetical protein LTR50_003941 [Elasticomyces elasticus]|nr:hypothetical protein LTR50_003941 [Elasticomyces elasticus]